MQFLIVIKTIIIMAIFGYLTPIHIISDQNKFLST